MAKGDVMTAGVRWIRWAVLLAHAYSCTGLMGPSSGAQTPSSAANDGSGTAGGAASGDSANGNQPTDNGGADNTTNYKVGQVQGPFTKVALADAANYNASAVVKNSQQNTVTLLIWPQAGAAGPDSGSFDNVLVTETLKPGQSTAWTIAAGTPGAFAVTPPGTNPWGNAAAGTGAGYVWCEFNAAVAGGWGGVDKSRIPGHHGDFTLNVNGSVVTGAWETPSDSPNGRDVGIAPGQPLHILVTY